MHDGFAHQLEQRQGRLVVRFIAAGHDGQRAGAGAAVPAGYRRVQGLEAPFPGKPGDFPPERGAGGGHVDEQRALFRAVQDAAVGEIDRFDVPGEPHHGDDGFAAPDAVADPVMLPGAFAGQRRGLGGRAGIHAEAVPALHQVARHAQAHDADADKRDVQAFSPSSDFSPAPPAGNPGSNTGAVCARPSGSPTAPVL